MTGRVALHHDQVPIGVDTARRLILDQFPRFRHERIEPLATAGTVNAIFRVGRGAAARFRLRPADPDECAAMLGREAAAMTELAGCCPVPTPLPVGIGQPGHRYPMPWSIHSWVEGEVATPDGLAASAEFGLDLARLVLALRGADTRGRRFEGEGRGGRLPDHDAWMAVCFARSERLLDVPRLRRIWARLRELPPAGSDVMSHGDLIPANLLVGGGRLVGVLDGGGFGPADPALDLVVAWHLLDRERRERFRERIGSSDIEWRRGAAWALQQAMGLVWYYERTNPEMGALGRSTLGRIVEDPGISPEA